MKKKLLSILCSSILAVSILAGCTSGGGNNNNSNPNTNPTVQAATQTNSQTAGIGEDDLLNIVSANIEEIITAEVGGALWNLISSGKFPAALLRSALK